MKVRFVTTFLFIVILLPGLKSCRKSGVTSVWSLIDNQTVLVYESDKPALLNDKLLASTLYKSSGKEYIACVQPVSKNTYDFLYICKAAPDVANGLAVSNKVTSRLLEGFAIQEVKKDGKVDLVWTKIDDYLIVSKSATLVENAIRIYRSNPAKNFKTKNQLLYGFVTLKADAGNLWVNYEQLNKTPIPLFKFLQGIPVFKNFASASVLDVHKNTERISLSGFTLDSLNKELGLARFQNQNPTKIDGMRFVPNSTKILIHYGLSNVDAFLTGDPDELLKSDIRDEIGVCVLDDSNVVIFLRVKEGYPVDKFDFVESYSGYDIRVNAENLTKSIKSLLPEKDFSFFTFKDDYLFFAENTSTIKQLIDAIEADETWGRSVSFQQFFNTCLQEGNVSMFYTREALLTDGIANGWEPLIDSLNLKSLTWGSIQFNSLDNHFFTSANFNLETRKQPQRIKPERKQFELPNSLALAYLVKNQTGIENEILAQDSTYKLYLFSKTAGVQWVYSMTEKAEQIQQLDYFKNGKLQYIITTASYIYLIDRLGRDVDGFPKKKDLNYRFSEIVDYDKSKNYRVLVTSGDNDVFILDKSMKELEGWSPKKLNAQIRTSPKHYRIGGKDYFLILSADGMVHVFNRRGDYEKGFPIKIDKNISGDYFFEPGNSLLASALYFVSADGKVQKVGMDGKITTDNLVRGNKSKFILANSVAGKSDAFFFRIDIDKVAVFNKNGELVFERQNPGSQRLKPCVVKTSEGMTYFSLFDEEQNLSYFFNTTGDGIINRPIETTLPPLFEVNQKTKQVMVYSIYQNTITATPLN
ncbi:MAG: hypothetical protein KF856_06800 [Cyclobacteriaceae bacterium]|nr:hypothetical protein [Cyclobacteriaceae bacterium]